MPKARERFFPKGLLIPNFRAVRMTFSGPTRCMSLADTTLMDFSRAFLSTILPANSLSKFCGSQGSDPGISIVIGSSTTTVAGEKPKVSIAVK